MRIADGRRHARIGNRDNHVGVRGRFLGEFATERLFARHKHNARP